MMNLKKRVNYTGHVVFHENVIPEEREEEYSEYMDIYGTVTTADVYGVTNHPKLGKQRVAHTSVVINIINENAFETLNTIYVKVPHES
jgi:hypothetical protein